MNSSLWNLLHSIDSNLPFWICLLAGNRIELNQKFMKFLRLRSIFSSKSAWRTYFNSAVQHHRFWMASHMKNLHFLGAQQFHIRCQGLAPGEWIILRSAPCVIKKRRSFNTFLLNVSSQDRFGLPSFCHWRLEEQRCVATNTHLPTGGPKLFVKLRRRAEKE